MTLVSILGEFDSSIFPIFFEYKRELHKHILIYSPSFNELKHLARVKNGLNAIIEKYHLKCELEFIEIDSNNLAEIRSIAKNITANIRREELMLNATDGQSILNLILGKIFISFGAKIVLYDRYKNSYMLLEDDEIKQLKIINNMSVEDHIISKGYRLVTYKTKRELNRKKQYVMSIVEEFGLFQVFRKLAMHEKRINDPIFLPIKHALMQLGITTNKGNILKDQYILGGLFEEIIYHIASDLGFDDLICAAVMVYGTAQQPIKNEFDLLLIKDNHLNIIECKFRDKIDAEHLIYKYDSLLHHLDRDGKVMIVNVASTYKKYKNNKTIFDKNIKNRAENANILIYNEPTLNIEKLKLMIKSFFEV